MRNIVDEIAKLRARDLRVDQIPDAADRQQNPQSDNDARDPRAPLVRRLRRAREPVCVWLSDC